jgi:hypothetical protein
MLQLSIKDQFYVESARSLQSPDTRKLVTFDICLGLSGKQADRQRRIVLPLTLTTIVGDMELGKFKSSVQDGALIYSRWGKDFTAHYARCMMRVRRVYKHSHHT